MTRLTSLPERALELASVMGDNLKQAVPTVGHHAGKWLETGVKLGALKGGVRVAGGLLRRHPVLVAASVAGAGLLWYAAHRKKVQRENGEAMKAAPVASKPVAPPGRPGSRATARRKPTSFRIGPARAFRPHRLLRPSHRMRLRAVR